MGTVFVSQSDRDLPTPNEIVRGYLERAVLRSTGYLIRITEAVAACDPLVLPVSANSIRPDHTTGKAVGTFENSSMRPQSARVPHDRGCYIRSPWRNRD